MFRTPARLALATVTAVCTIAAGGILLHAHLNSGDSHAPAASTAPAAQPDARTVTVYVDRPVVEYRDTLHADSASAYADGFSDGTDAAINRLFDALNVPCETEDSEECYWDAATHGNGEGRPFVNINGRVVYLDFQ